jgi:hypothetical protein
MPKKDVAEMGPLFEVIREFAIQRRRKLRIAASARYDCTRMSFDQMSDLVRSVWLELKRRNPIGVNMYAGAFAEVIRILNGVGEAEEVNATCEAGPGIDLETDFDLLPEHMKSNDPFSGKYGK